VCAGDGGGRGTAARARGRCRRDPRVVQRAARAGPLSGSVIDPAVLAGMPGPLHYPRSSSAALVDALLLCPDADQLGDSGDRARRCPVSAAAKRSSGRVHARGRRRAAGPVSRIACRRMLLLQSRCAEALGNVGALSERLSHHSTSISLRGSPVIVASAHSLTRAPPILPFRLAGTTAWPPLLRSGRRPYRP
jgi:hypothetical protein